MKDNKCEDGSENGKDIIVGYCWKHRSDPCSHSWAHATIVATIWNSFKTKQTTVAGHIASKYCVLNSIFTLRGKHFVHTLRVVLSRCRLLDNFKNRRKFEKIEVIRIVRFSVVNVWSGSVYQHKTGFPKLAGSRFCRNLKFSLMIDTLSRTISLRKPKCFVLFWALKSWNWKQKSFGFSGICCLKNGSIL